MTGGAPWGREEASHSITSSARASSVGGTSKPSALAVYPLDLLCQREPIASDLLIRASYGRVAGLRRAVIGGERSLSVIVGSR
jgi:hypothetical protein